jgi:hypothetical protein
VPAGPGSLLFRSLPTPSRHASGPLPTPSPPAHHLLPTRSGHASPLLPADRYSMLRRIFRAAMLYTFGIIDVFRRVVFCRNELGSRE